jgi:tRNA A-37 threonylcarbamoyl transferase component Bud32
MTRNSQELDRAKQADFAELASGLEVGDLRSMFDLTDKMNHSGGRSKSLLNEFDGNGNRLFLASDAYDLVAQSGPPKSLTFTPQPALRAGRDNSRNGVFFGGLKAEWPEEDKRSSVQIAVKPICARSDVEAGRIIHEAAMYQHLGHIGLSTFDVVGVTMFASPRNQVRGHVITSFRPEVRTVDNMPWSRMSEEDKNTQALETLSGLAQLHLDGVFHGDPYFRNLAFSESEHVYVDLEFGSSFRDSPDDTDAIRRQISSDLEYFSRSMDYNIFTREQSILQGQDKVALLTERIFEPYRQYIEDSKSLNRGVLLEAYDRMLAERKKDFKGS